MPKITASDALRAGRYHLLQLIGTICIEGICHVVEDGTFLYRDTGHLSNDGSRWLGAQPQFRDDLASALSSQLGR